MLYNYLFNFHNLSEPIFLLKGLTCDTNYSFTIKAVSLGTDTEPVTKLINVEVKKKNKLSIM